MVGGLEEGGELRFECPAVRGEVEAVVVCLDPLPWLEFLRQAVGFEAS